MLVKRFEKDGIKAGIYSSRKSMGKAAAKECAKFLKSLLKTKAEVNMIFAAAPSQNETLYYLTRTRGIDWSRVRAFHMDEYVGLSKNDRQSFAAFLENAVFSKVNFKEVYYISEENMTSEQLCERYSALLEKYPPDIVCLGIGENGHIAFNDPHVAKFDDDKKVKIVDLDLKCRTQQVNDKCFETLDDVPKYAVTLTVPALMSASCLICTVPGTNKAQAVYDTINGPVGESCPATAMRLHKNAHLFLDKASAGKLTF